MENFLIVIVGLVLAFIYLFIQNKKRAKETSLKYLQRELDKLKTRWSHNQATAQEIYKVALDVLSKVTKNTNLSNEQRYDLLHELNELLDIHISYRIRIMKNSKELIKHFGSLWSGVATLPVEDEKYSLIKKVTGAKGKIISLFWNDRDHFFYSVLSERSYIIKLIEDEYALLKKEKNLSCYDGDLFNLATKLRQIFVAHLDNYPKNVFEQEMNLAVGKLEEIIKSMNQ